MDITKEQIIKQTEKVLLGMFSYISSGQITELDGKRFKKGFRVLKKKSIYKYIEDNERLVNLVSIFEKFIKTEREIGFDKFIKIAVTAYEETFGDEYK